MTANEIVRSWKEEDCLFDSRSGDMVFMPSNPAGLIELNDEELLGIGGGTQTSEPCGVILGRVASAAVGASAGGLVSLAVTVAAITIYTYLSS
jgi:mersacidin/lichenicidin family type 2 lantibiotic